MQDCHCHGKISEFVSKVNCLVHIVQVENEDKVDSKKAKGNASFLITKRSVKSQGISYFRMSGNQVM